MVYSTHNLKSPIKFDAKNLSANRLICHARKKRMSSAGYDD